MMSKRHTANLLYGAPQARLDIETLEMRQHTRIREEYRWIRFE